MEGDKILQAACSSASDWDRLHLLLSQEEEAVNHLFEQVDQSDYSLPDWIKAILSFDEWLSRQDVTERPTANMIGYIHCCTMTAPDTLTLPDLSRLTREMLEQHGFDATKDAEPDE